MNFTNIRHVALILFTVMLTACGSDWQTSTPGSGGTGNEQIPTGTNPSLPANATITISGIVEAATATTVKVNGIEYKITPKTQYLNSKKILVGIPANVIVNTDTQEVVSIDQSSPNTSQELTPLHKLITLMSNSSFYQINTGISYTKITSPTNENLNDYHWLQTQYQLVNAPYIWYTNSMDTNWQDISMDTKTLLPTGEWTMANDKKLTLHANENYAEANVDQSLKGKYTMIGDGINLESKGYPIGSLAFNIQYTPYQDEYIIEPSASRFSDTSLSLDEMLSEDKIEDENNLFSGHHVDIYYGHDTGVWHSYFARLVENSNEKQGKVQFLVFTDLGRPCYGKIDVSCPASMHFGLYSETGTWERLNIAGNDIIKITPPASLKNSLIESYKADKILVKLANSIENVKIGKYYPANQPINMKWYNQTAMDYILQQGLMDLFYTENQ